MKNADMPAMPQNGTEGHSGDLNNSEDWGGSGLTKREQFSAMAMQGLLAKPAGEVHPEMVMFYAVSAADALLVELDKSITAHSEPQTEAQP